MARLRVGGCWWGLSVLFFVALACSETGKPDDGTAGSGGTVVTGGGGVGRGGAGGLAGESGGRGGGSAGGRGGSAGGCDPNGAGGRDCTDCHGFRAHTCRDGQLICEQAPDCASGGRGGGAAGGRGGSAGGAGGSAGGSGGCAVGGISGVAIDCGDCNGIYAPSCVGGQWVCNRPTGVCPSGGRGGGAAGAGGGAAGRGGSGGATACASATTLEACDARSDCHAVFQDPGTCGCASPGCCAHFSRCADGDRADCTSNGIGCEMATPHCESPYTVSYANLCYEGCVRNTECMATP